MATARYYQPDRNPEGAAFSGVPLSDIDDAAWARLPAWKKGSVDAWWGHNGHVYRQTLREVPDPLPVPPDESPVDDDDPLPEGM